MNLDRTFCVSDCRNYLCDRMLSYSVVCAAEKAQKPVSQQDFSVNCEDYLEKEREDYLEKECENKN